MGTINSAVSLMSGALDADQEALSVVANNVANANTTGYTEEKPNWQENAPINIGGLSVGDGVTEAGVTSQRDRVLEERLDQQQQLAAASSARLTALNNIQALFTPDSGSTSADAGDIGSDITSFFNSFSSLEADPTDNALREQVLSSASTLAGDISGAANSLNEQSAALNQDAAGIASQVNSLTSAVAQLNLEIQSTSANADAGTLEDQRQQDLSQLSQLIGINQVTTENNGLSVTTTSGQLLVSEGQSFQLTTGPVSGATDFFVGGTDITAELASGGGQLGGYLTARDQDIPSALNSLDQLAYNISTAVNTQNNAGIDASGNTGAPVAGSTTGAMTLDIFSPPPTYAANLASSGTAVTGAAAAMSVVMTDPSEIAAASAGNGTGDNSNAVAMAGIAGKAIVNGQTPINSYSNFVSTLGSTVLEVQTGNAAQNASVTQLQTQNNALSSVNLNDEAAAMSTLETSYQAASQVFTLLNTIMASALNLGEQTTVA
jgi:flagellar hook-associated protein 1